MEPGAGTATGEVELVEPADVVEPDDELPDEVAVFVVVLVVLVGVVVAVPDPVVPVPEPVVLMTGSPDVTSNASTQIQVPPELEFFVPVPSTVIVWLPELRPVTE